MSHSRPGIGVLNQLTAGFSLDGIHIVNTVMLDLLRSAGPMNAPT